MKVDVYDTYATAPDGRLLHFDFYVPSGSSQSEVGRLAHIYVGGKDPEIEAERRLASQITRDPTIMVALRSEGFSVQPLLTLARRAA